MRAALFALVAAALSCSPTSRQEPPDRPNIVLILADDLGFSDVGSYGGEIETPNLDELAAAGLRFSQFYTTASCRTTRASLMSGRYWQDAGRGFESGPTLAEALRAAGYTTLATGKWHLAGRPTGRGFDRYFGHLNGASDYFLGNDTFLLDGAPYRVAEEGFYTTDAFTDYAIRFVEESRAARPAKPFFLYVAYNAPHDPIQAWPADVAKYRGRYDTGWDRIRAERHARQLALGIVRPEWPLSPRPAGIPAWEELDAEARAFESNRMAVYAAAVDRIDQNVGRLMRRLRELGVADDTLVLFLSDNGANPFDRVRRGTMGDPGSHWNYGMGWANASNAPFRLYKRNQHAGGIATPAIAHWPAGIRKAGGITDQAAHVIDVLPTLIELAGSAWPESSGDAEAPPLAGASLVPVLNGDVRTPHPALFFQLIDHKAVIREPWKLVSASGGPWELYRLDRDRTELNDLAGVNPETVRDLEAQWRRWYDALPFDSFRESREGEPVYRPAP